LSDLVDALVPERVDESRFRFPPPPEGRGIVFGGHLLAQMLVASSKAKRAGEGKTVRSVHGIFAKTVSADAPCEVTVDVLHAGRVLASAAASIWQDGSERARALVMLSTPEQDLIRHQADAPNAGSPESAIPVEDAFGREVRVVGEVDPLDPSVVGPPKLAVWIRWPDPPEDAGLRQALLTHGSASFLMRTALLPHPGISERLAHVAFSTGIIAHTVSFHETIDLSRWLLFSQESTHAGGGRAYGVGQVFTEDGVMVASFNQEAIIRPFPEGHSPEGRETTVL
jgi:acyl-CoA thioesterase-2